ncbi:N-formylglutamate amidohydrolase [Vineibacter terrae]|uniref:N-formylglutamate amidohydrolase n=1 Tax=Vineibacter terrae TaxID=2586908 RepID=A0A5C8P8V3_9HYPH|nr:N-formylglutamate amidohydrolase [Vineibacter terrae]TXL69785.1 N-formylglutamate amidohydrolase [Vineibacter terrae]
MPSLLSAGDPPPFATINPAGSFPLLLLCDHAGKAVPRALDGLGIAAQELARHIGWDIGALDVATELARLLDAPLVASTYSRLVIDCNRWPGGEGSIPEISDGTKVPGNAGLTEAGIRARADACFWPYHNEVERLIADFAARGVKPALLVVHSFTPAMGGVQRPWQLGVLWRSDERLPLPLLAELRKLDGVLTGDNEPYSARASYEYTLTAHADSHGLPHCSLEIRQDLIRTRENATAWARRLAPAVTAAVAAALADSRP